MFRYKLRMLLILLAVVMLTIACLRPGLAWFLLFVLLATALPCAIATYIAIALGSGLMYFVERNNEGAVSRFESASRAGLIVMLVLYSPAFILNVTLSAGIGIDRAQYLDLMPLIIASLFVIPVISGLVSLAVSIVAWQRSQHQNH